MRLHRRARVLVVLLVATLVADQLAQHTALRGGHLAGRRVAPFDPPLFSPIQRRLLNKLREAENGGETLLALSQHDSELGWMPGGHYTPMAQEIVARSLSSILDSER